MNECRGRKQALLSLLCIHRLTVEKICKGIFQRKRSARNWKKTPNRIEICGKLKVYTKFAIFKFWVCVNVLACERASVFERPHIVESGWYRTNNTKYSQQRFFQQRHISTHICERNNTYTKRVSCSRLRNSNSSNEISLENCAPSLSLSLSLSFIGVSIKYADSIHVRIKQT